MSNSKTKVVTGVVRLSYCHLWEPAAITEGAKPKFSVSLIIRKDDKETIDKINSAIDAAIEEATATKFGGKKPNKATLKGAALRDGDEKDDEAYKGSFFLNASSNEAPQIVDKNVNPILDRSLCYSGCYARVSINFYAYAVSGQKGIAVGLGNVQVVKEGTPLGGKASASSDFKATNEEFI